MKKLLTDIELDFYELKCLLEYLDKNPQDQNIYKVTQRSLKNLTSRMFELEAGFDKNYLTGDVDAPVGVTPSQPEEVLATAPIIESSNIEQGAMFRALSLNDVFRFSRELFSGDTNKLKEVVTEMEMTGSYEQAMGCLATQVTCKTDDPAFLDMDDFLQRYFKY